MLELKSPSLGEHSCHPRFSSAAVFLANADGDCCGSGLACSKTTAVAAIKGKDVDGLRLLFQCSGHNADSIVAPVSASFSKYLRQIL